MEDDGDFDPDTFPIRYTKNPRDRGTGLLTYDDRAYLLGEKDLDETGEQQLRQRLRDRIRNGLLDFELLIGRLDENDIETIAADITPPPWESDGEERAYRSIQLPLAFLYYMVSEHTPVSFDRLLETAIEGGTHRSRKQIDDEHRRLVSAKVDIDVDWMIIDTDTEVALEKLRNGEELADQHIAKLVRHGDLEDADWERLREVPDH